MIEQFVSVLVWLIFLVPLGVFMLQVQRVRNGTRDKVKATLLFFCFSFVPVLAYVLVFLALVGIEELTKRAIISEGLSRTLPITVGIGVIEVVLLTAIFAIVASFLPPARKRPARKAN